MVLEPAPVASGARPDGGTFPRRDRAPPPPDTNAPIAAEVATTPAPPRSRPTRQRCIVPATLFPDYECLENDGHGWTADITQKSKDACRVRYVHATDDTGQPWAPTWLRATDVLPMLAPAGDALAAATHACIAAVDDEVARPRPDAAFTLLMSADETPSAIHTPKTRAEAERLDPEQWPPAIRKELDACTRNKCYRVIQASTLPPDRRVLNLLWVFKVKRDGTFKARLCVQGSRQQLGTDYDQSWSGALRASSLRLLTALAARNGMMITRFDLTSAFLQGALEESESVFTRPPPTLPATKSTGKY